MSENSPPSAMPARRDRAWQLFWLLVLIGLTALFSYWIDALRNPNRELRSTVSGDTIETTLERNRNGHYHLTGQINGAL